MKQSIIKIVLIISIVILFFIGMIYNIYSHLNITKTNEIKKFNSQTTDVYISNNKDIFVKQIIDFKNCIPTDSFEKTVIKLDIPLLDNYKNELYSSSYDIHELKSNISLFNKGKKIDYYGRSESINMKMLEIEKYQYNQLINELKKNNYKVIFSYKIDVKKVLSYDDNNNIVLCLNGNNKFHQSNELCIHLPNNVYILNENNNYINQKNKNMYRINLKRKNLNYEIKIQGDLGTNLDLNTNNKSNRYTDFYIVLNIFVIITFMFLFILILAYIQKRTKIEKGEYERETSSVIHPILAESIIDGKIDAKDLIMTCIVSLIYKKKIENIDNDSLKLIDTTDLSDIEREVLEIVYATPYPIENYRGQIAKISNINVIFKKENKKSQNIYQKFKIIKKIIKEQLFELKILNKIWNFILMQVRALSCLVILNLMIIFGAGQENLFYSLNGTMLLLIIFANVLIYIVSFDFGTTYILNASSTKHSGRLAIVTIILFINIIIGVISNLEDIDTEL